MSTAATHDSVLVDVTWTFDHPDMIPGNVRTDRVDLGHARSRGREDFDAMRRILAIAKLGDLSYHAHIKIVCTDCYTSDGVALQMDADGILQTLCEACHGGTAVGQASERVRAEVVRLTGADNVPERITFENTGGGCMCLILWLTHTVLVVGQDGYEIFEYSHAAWLGESDEQPDKPYASPATANAAARLLLDTLAGRAAQGYRFANGRDGFDG